MRNLLKEHASSLSSQSIFLILGKVLSLPLTFLVPIILVRFFDITMFGHYKQLFMLFYIALPLLDFGISQGLIYYISKDPERRNKNISQFLQIQFVLCLIGGCIFFFFNKQLALLVSGDPQFAHYIPYLGGFLITWSISSHLEVILTAQKKTVSASWFIFFSETFRAIFVIAAVLVGGKLQSVLLILLGVGGIRIIWMFWYLVKNSNFSFQPIDTDLLWLQCKYAIPLGFAVAINSFIDYSHQIIVSRSFSSMEFAIYSVGCFQVPLIGVVTGSVSRVALVRLTELYQQNQQVEIVEIIAASFRKLALIFFPLFAILLITSEDFVVLLYTDSYRSSIPIFRIFIWILPLAAILVEYIPRALGNSVFVVRVNTLTLLFNIIIVLVMLKLFGIAGAAVGFVCSRAVRKVLILNYIQKQLNTSWLQLFNVRSLLPIIGSIAVSMLPVYVFQSVFKFSNFINLICQWSLFYVLCFVSFWFFGVITSKEKDKIVALCR